MEEQVQTIIVPYGYELKNIGNNQYAIVQKYCTTTQQTSEEYDRKHTNSFFKREVEVRDDYDFDEQRDKLFTNSDRDELFNARYNGRYDYLHEMYNNGKIKKLSQHEMDLLRFCHGINVKEYIREEFRKNPIVIKQDENGYIYAETPMRNNNFLQD